MLQSHPPALTSIEIDNPSVLDMLWGALMATGDERYVIRVMSILPWAREQRDGMKLAIGGAAEWSLTSNCVTDEKVLEICREQLGKQPREVSRVLSDVIKKAEAEIKKERRSK